MKPRTFALALLLLLVDCTFSYAAPPKVTLEAEGAADYAILAPGKWFDLLVHIDPQGAPIAADGLEVLTSAPARVEVDPPILPPADGQGTYAKPFVVRVPVKLTGKAELEVRVRGKHADGTGIEVHAKATLETDTNARGHLTGKAKLKKPAVAGEANAMVVDLEILPPYHVYGELGKGGVPMFGLVLPGRGTGPKTWWTGGEKTIPPGDAHKYGLTFEIPFTPAVAGRLKARALINWQACTDKFCEANEIAYLPVEFEVKPGKTTSDIAAPVPAAASSTHEDDDGLGGKSLLQIALLALGAGLFALVMPCTYPLIPITISFFTKQAEQRHGKVLPLALAYGAGIVLVFVITGVMVGEFIQVFAAFWWVNLIFALLFLFFGLSLIGLFEIRLPAWVNNIAGKTSGTGGYLSVFAMGTTLVITSFTCTAPFVGSLLVFAAKEGSTFTVAFAMVVFGLTMAIPFVLLSLSPKGLQALPKSGVWMKTLKVTLRIVELGLVLKFVSNIDLAFHNPPYIDRELFLVLWALSFLAAGLYLLDLPGLRRKLFQRGKAPAWAAGPGRLLSAAMLLLVGSYLLTGIRIAQQADPETGAPELHQRLAKVVESFVPPNPTYTRGFLKVVYEDFDKGVQVATELNAPIFLNFTGFV